MKKGGIGGSNTQTGMKFEKNTDLKEALLSIEGIKIIEHMDRKTKKTKKPKIISIEVYQLNRLVGYIFQKHDLYKNFLEKKKINWRTKISKKLLPDEAYFSLATNTLIIIEKKYQEVPGSVDEKLQTCDFKKKQYEKLCAPLRNVKVEYVYVLNDWFTKKEYKDVLKYVKEKGCKYFFNQLPYQLLGINV